MGYRQSWRIRVEGERDFHSGNVYAPLDDRRLSAPSGYPACLYPMCTHTHRPHDPRRGGVTGVKPPSASKPFEPRFGNCVRGGRSCILTRSSFLQHVPAVKVLGGFTPLWADFRLGLDAL